MNVRTAVLLPVLMLFALFVTEPVLAEKGGGGPEQKGKPVQQKQVPPSGQQAKNDNVKGPPAHAKNEQPASASGDKKGKPKEMPAEKAANPPQHAGKEKHRQSSRKQEKPPKKLPEEANEKAKEAVHKTNRNSKSQKPKKSQASRNVSRQEETAQKDTEQAAKRADKKSEGQRKKPRSDQGAPVKKQEKNDSKVSKDTSEEEENTKEEFPAPLPVQQKGELPFLKNQQSVKIPAGASHDNSGSYKTKMEVLLGEVKHLRVLLMNPFVERHCMFRNQWVNAPPTPPPQTAPSFLRFA
ncbi:hypothetical protein SAMN05192534_10919 [Alteribacillus persepolensis]|uniref:Uncharacterized protein n=1 Tax=Alteribacillus persepolensis TaxID=568899 RepID=A0A1G8EB63_9BACI|nr:hypothetical protein [Alteribacillus persepolensis]SDH67175.1 hypothetical protein SAMN05192534_10919 [Alteribacillus persepolensis]